MRGADQTAEVVERTTLLWLRTLNLLDRFESAAAAASHHNTVASLPSAPAGTQIKGTLHVQPAELSRWRHEQLRQRRLHPTNRPDGRVGRNA